MCGGKYVNVYCCHVYTIYKWPFILVVCTEIGDLVESSREKDLQCAGQRGVKKGKWDNL